MKSKRFIEQHSITIYFFLAFMISWGLIGVLAGAGNIPINAEESQELLPLLYVSMLFGPSVAGLLLISLLEGKKGFRRLVSRLFRWRLNIWWYVFALFATPVLASIILVFLSFFYPEFQIGLSNSDHMTSLLITGIATAVVVGVFEEIGWTGFVIPRLLLRHNIFTSGLIVGVLWGLWHFILFWENDSFFGLLPFIMLVGRLFAWLPPFRILMAWIYNSTGSLLLTILTHASLVFTTTIIVPVYFTGRVLLVWLIAWGVVLWILAIAVLSINRRIH